jgi:hypothetical protein
VSTKRALQISFALSLLGVLFSGVLTYRELFGTSAVSCPTPGAPGTIFGYPACVYGFFVFLALTVVTAAGLGEPKTDDPDHADPHALDNRQIRHCEDDEQGDSKKYRACHRSP